MSGATLADRLADDGDDRGLQTGTIGGGGDGS